MNILQISTAVAAVLTVLLAGTASATQYVVTYTGTVSSGYDGTGVFGVAGANLTADPFTAVYTYNTGVGVRATVAGVSDSVTGGSYIGQPSVASAKLTINGVTVSFSGAQASSADAEPGYAAEYAGFGVNDYVDNNISAAGLSATLNETLPFTAGSPTNGNFFQLSSLGRSATGGFSTETIQISALPEPTTWAVLLMGVGLIGLQLRRARRQLPLVA